MLHQASCVSIGGRGLLIEGPPGSGKSSLVLALLDRGATLVGDDGVELSVTGDRLLASPAPQTAGLLEIRNVGILRRPCTQAVPLALAIALSQDAPRYVETAGERHLAGVTLPQIRLFPDSPVLHLRAEAALALYGLPVCRGTALEP